MTTHLRARAVQAGAFLVMVGGTIAVAASPAHAVPPTVTIDSVSSTSVKPGERIALRFTITSVSTEQDADVEVTVSGMDCSGDCSPQVGVNQRQSFTANLTAGPVDAGQSKTVRVQVSARLGNETGNATRTITVKGPDKPKLVRQISGRVKDSDGKAVAGAQVLMRDSAGHQYDTTSNDDGGYEFTSSESRPIAPGTVSIGAAKEGFEPAAVNVRANADKTVTVALTLVSKNAPTPTATPSATETPTAEPLDDADEAEEPTEQAAPNPDNAANTSEDDGGSMLFIILGGLLVAAGIGAIVLVLMRRKSDGDDGDSGKPAGGGPVPPSRGGFADDATRVAAPVGGRGGGATMIAGAGMGAAPSLSDAPTMLQRAVPAEDEFPDPYGAPASPPQAGTYGGGGNYGGGSGAAYGGYSPQEQQQYAGYGAPAAAPQQRYDEPTGMYRPDDQGGYDNGYAQPGGATAYQAAYDEPDQAGYDNGWGNAGDGIDNGNAYGSGGGYAYPEQPQQQYGYDAAGYDDGAAAGGQYGGSGEYDQRAVYGRPEGSTYGAQSGAYGGGTYGAPAGGGYDEGGYEGGGQYGGDQGGGRHGGGPRAQGSGHPGQRRSVDWLDD